MDERDMLTDDAKLLDVLLRSQLAEPAWRVGELAGVEPAEAERALARMTTGDTDYPVLRRLDLGPDWYEAIEDSARQWRDR
jgi:hypothetical protein